MRLIDVDIDVNDYVETWDCNCITGGIQTVMAVDDLSYLPTIDAVPVRHGKWIGYETNSFKNSCEGLKRKFYRCSVCRTANAIRVNYCPNCGTKMDGDINAAD